MLNVFQDGMCHPKMAMVIDDRSKVWEDKDQPRVHVVPPFAPYYALQVETANVVPVLCVTRNVACSVRDVSNLMLVSYHPAIVAKYLHQHFGCGWNHVLGSVCSWPRLWSWKLFQQS